MKENRTNSEKAAGSAKNGGGSTSRSAAKAKKKDAHRGDPTGSGQSAKPTRASTADAASRSSSGSVKRRSATEG